MTLSDVDEALREAGAKEAGEVLRKLGKREVLYLAWDPSNWTFLGHWYQTPADEWKPALPEGGNYA